MRLPRSLRRLLLPLYQHAHTELHELSWLFLELTNRCDLRCRHCGSDCVRDPGTPDLPREQISRVLDELGRRYDPRRIMIALSGGEPLLYPDLFGLGRELTQRGFPWGLVTNGWGWTREAVTAAAQAGLGSVTVSVDGFRAEHDWFRGVDGSFDRAVRTIRYFLEDPGGRAMDVVTCVHPRNLATLDEFRSFLIGLGLRKWRVFVVSPIGRARDCPELRLDGPGLRQLLDRIVAYRKQPELEVAYSEAGYLGPEYELRVREFDHFCRAGIRVAGIMVNGDILACPNIDRRFRQGNLARVSFIRVWEKGFREFRDRRWMKNGECARCAEWRLCRGESFHLRDFATRSNRRCHYRLLTGAPPQPAPQVR